MKAVRNDETKTWHLLGSRGCGVDPTGEAYGEVFEGTWAEVRDEVERDAATPCRNCRWPRH